jgi:predicted O-linked N-acetylglucosamine transferase (SPINDLY family)
MYGRVDIALDTYPYCGATTTCEALYMGVPVVTVAGQARVSRMGLSLLTNLGLPQLVAQSFEEYRQIAIRLAGEPRQLADLRSGLRQRLLSSPIAQAQQFTRHLEAAYRETWRAHCGGRAATPD